jgi:glycosyltransferase involved in cell wall biosynthesis
MALYVTSSFLQRRYPTRGYSDSASDVFVGTMSDSENARRESRLAELAQGRKPVFGTIAKLNTKSKGVQTALAALARFRAAGNDYVYRVLGPGPLDEWRQLAKDFGVSDIAHFDGTRGAGEGVSAWLDEIDIYLQPSFQEGLPRATIEAMSRGAACIGSTCGGIPELLPSENLHRPGDVAGLADRMQRLIANPEEVAAASREARRRAAQFDPHALQERRRQFYARLRGMAERPARA